MALGLPIAMLGAELAAGGATRWTSAALALALAGVAARALVRLRGTTLAAPAAWALAAALVLAAVEATLAWRGDWDGTLGASIARYAAAVGTFCPLMAVLGAKRPQDRGWQWVVLSLWIVLLVPASQAWAARGGGQLELSAPWRIMIGGLVAIELLNYLPTRNGSAALIFAGGQTALLATYLIDGPLWTASRDRVAAGVAFVVATGLASALCRRRSNCAAGRTVRLTHLTDRWLVFRNGWGAFWGLRIMNRVNESAELGGWPVRLEWGGFAASDGAPSIEIDGSVAAKVQQTMDSLLRRFERRECGAE